jgi:hypothetical protein
MEQHPIPRNITGFEFKLIGFMTLKQLLYLVIFAPIGYIVYALFPIPLLNILLGLAVGSIGVALAFVPINDRPLDVWIRNFWKRLNSPTQFFYHKHNPPLAVFSNLYFVTDPHRVLAHVESQQMLSKYLASTRQTMAPNVRKQQVQKTITTPVINLRVKPVRPAPHTAAAAPMPTGADPIAQRASQMPPASSGEKKPFFIGEVKNNKHISLPGILIYVKDTKGTPVRLLKTNPHGIFATYNPLPAGEYTFEMKDPKSIYFFDTMKITIADRNTASLEIVSKEML